MKINDLYLSDLIQDINPDLKAGQQQENDATRVTFADTIKEFLNTVNNKQIEADQKIGDVIKGESEDLAGAMMALRESNLSFQLMLEIRNKLIEAVQEVNRTQV